MGVRTPEEQPVGRGIVADAVAEVTPDPSAKGARLSDDSKGNRPDMHAERVRFTEADLAQQSGRGCRRIRQQRSRHGRQAFGKQMARGDHAGGKEAH